MNQRDYPSVEALIRQMGLLAGGIELRLVVAALLFLLIEAESSAVHRKTGFFRSKCCAINQIYLEGNQVAFTRKSKPALAPIRKSTSTLTMAETTKNGRAYLVGVSRKCEVGKVTARGAGNAKIPGVTAFTANR
jgi:hypothetical protein